MRPAVYVLIILLAVLNAQAAPHGRNHAYTRPNPDDPLSIARWLVQSNDWGVVSTVSVRLNGMPFGNVAWYSDGPDGNATGVPYYYLSSLDPTPRDIAIIPYSSLTVTESPLGTCKRTDVEKPMCAKITLSGQMHVLLEDSEESKFAAQAVFSKHPEMKGWPKDHSFQFYKLSIQDIYLIDWYGGAQMLWVKDYLNANFTANFQSLLNLT